MSTPARHKAVREQLLAYQSMGYLRYDPDGTNHFRLTPTGGVELRLTLREAELWLSGLATGAKGRNAA